MFDSWIVGTAPDSQRRYVIHTTSPRFIIEIIELEYESWRAGALEWIDDPGPAEAARWSSEAGRVYFESIAARRGPIRGGTDDG